MATALHKIKVHKYKPHRIQVPIQECVQSWEKVMLQNFFLLRYFILLQNEVQSSLQIVDPLSHLISAS